MPGTPETITLTASDGVYSNIADTFRPQTSLKVGNNLNQYPANVFTNRYCGWARQRPTALNGGAECFGFSSYVDNDGKRYLFMQYGDTLYEYDLGTFTETGILTGLSATTDLSKKAIPCMRMFVPYNANDPYMVYVNGKDKPQKITCSAGTFSTTDLQLNGADFGTVALDANLAGKTTSNPRFCEPFLDRMIYAGFTGQCAFDVLLTNAGDAEAATANSPIEAEDGGLFQVDPQLGLITAVKAFKLSNSDNKQIVIIGQERGVSVIIGTTAADFQCFTMTDEYGIPSNNTFVQIGSNLWFLGNDGVRQYAALAENSNLIGDTLTYPVQDLADRMNESQMYKAHAVHHKKFMEVQFWFPVDSDTTPQNAFIMSYIQSPKALQLSTAILTKDGTEVAASIYFDKTFYGGDSAGLLQKHHQSNLYDDAVVTSRLDLAQARVNHVGTDAQIIVYICTYGGGQKFIINDSYLANVNDSNGNFTLERQDAGPEDELLSGGGESGTILGAWSLGSSAFPSEHMRVFTFSPVGFGVCHDISLKCTDSDHVLDFILAQIDMEVTAKNAA